MSIAWYWPDWNAAPVACGDPEGDACTDPGCPVHGGDDEGAAA